MAAQAQRKARIAELEAQVADLEARLEQARAVYAEQEAEIERLTKPTTKSGPGRNR